MPVVPWRDWRFPVRRLWLRVVRGHAPSIESIVRLCIGIAAANLIRLAGSRTIRTGQSADPLRMCGSYHHKVMQRSVGDESSARHHAGSRSSLLGPTALDRLLDRAQRGAPILSTLSDVVLVCCSALLVLVDLAVWRNVPVIDSARPESPIAFLVPCLGFLATLTVALRHRRLGLALIALCVASLSLTIASVVTGIGLPPSFAALGALALMTTVVLRHEPGGSAILLTALAACAVSAEALRPMVSGAAYLLVLCEGAFAVAVGIGIYLRWADWRRLAAAEAARAEERFEIAREMHDMVGHYVTAMVVQAQAARHVAQHQPAAADAALDRIEQAGTEALVAMRRMVGGLRKDSPTTPTGTWDEIDQLLTDANAQGNTVHWTIDPDIRRLAPTLAPSVYRIISESLTNVRRHAHLVTSVDITLSHCGDSLVLTVCDDGVGNSPSSHDTFGIVGMRERAVALGGSLNAGPAPSGGWIVHAELPVERPR